MSGMVMCSRMALTTVKALQTESSMSPKGVIMMADSECTISALETTSRALKPFFHNRVGEVLENVEKMKKYCPVEDVHHLPGHLNPADVPTRGLAKVSELGPGSFRQKGPAFLCSGRALWPVSRDFVRKELPEEEICNVPAFLYSLRAWAMSSRSCAIQSLPYPDLWSAVLRVTSYSNDIKKVLRILAMVIKGWGIKSRKEILSQDTVFPPTPDDIQTAEKLLLLSAMPETYSALTEGRLTSLNPQRKGNIIVTCGRVGEKCLSKLLGASFLPILMPKSRAAYLYMVEAHTGQEGVAHCSVVETLARSRQKVWIVKARNLANQVRSQCPLCKRRNRKLAGQQMALIKEESLTICRPFTFISLDFAGPIKVKGTVNARATKKCWVVVYCCRATKAVVLLAIPGYDTASFLLKHEEFVARYGAPSTIVSDKGTQLVSAGRILAEKEAPGSWDWAKITSENAASSWLFVPIGSPHLNGLPEATVKVLKRSLSLALHPGVVLTYPELVTLLARISCSVNSRPLGPARISDTSQQEDHVMPITPNMMLLGRATNTSPPLQYSEGDRFCARLNYVAAVEKEWWDLWIKQVLPTLFSFRKWKVKKENIVVGELVMLRYPGQFKDDYCLAKVLKAVPDDDNLVRKVTVTYKKKNPKESPSICKSRAMITEEVAIHRLHRLELFDDEVAGQARDGADKEHHGLAVHSGDESNSHSVDIPQTAIEG